MRIGLITHNYPLTSNDRKDAGIFIYDFANELSKKSEVFVLCPNFLGKKERYKKPVVTWFDWSGGDSKLGSLSFLDPLSMFRFFNLLFAGSKATTKFVKNNQIDFLLSAWVLPAGIFGLVAKKTLGVPYATWSLGSDINQYGRIPVLKVLIGAVLKNADINFANSYELCNKTSKISGKKCYFLPAITTFHTTKKMKQSKEFSFLFVGRLERVKGVDILVRACRSLKDLGGDFKLSIVGTGSLERTILEMIDSYDLKDRVRLLGGKGESEVAQLMSSSDCLVVPSRNESLPLVLIEAAKSGLPVVATDVGDCKRLISDYKIGLVAKKENPENLAEKMLTALKEGKEFRSKRLKNLEKVGEIFDQKKAVEFLLNNIKSI